MPRLLLIGLDAGDLDFIRAHQGALPTLERFLLDGRCFETQSPKGLSGSVWPTFYTGSPPGEHGIYQHLVWDADKMGLRLIAPDWCHQRPFWADLEERGRRVVVMDVPYSFAGHLQHGIEIVDWGTQGQTQPFYCNHPGIHARIRREFGPSPIGRETPVHKNPRQLGEVRRTLIASAERKAALTEMLMRETEWDVFLSVFAETHRGGHALFPGEDNARADATTPLLEVYQAVDRGVARLIEGVDLEETTVMLFAVHGMTRDDNQAHVVRPLLERLNDRFMQEHFGVAPKTRHRSGWIRRLRSAVPPSLQLAVGARVPDAVRQWVVEREIVGGLDWSRTPGFALRTDIRSELRLNLRGREAKGILEPGSRLHRAYIEAVRETFVPLRDEDTGASLVDELVDIRELYPGGATEALPDLVITWNREPAARRVSAPGIGQIEFNPVIARGGDHTDFGFALLLGPNAENGELPPLKETHDFAGFVAGLVGRA